MPLERNDLVFFTESCSGLLVGCDKEIDIKKGMGAKVLSVYTDNGFWSDGYVLKYEHPFPAARVFLLDTQQIVDSIHVKILKKEL